MERIIGLGWDVGGWLGKNHGIAALEWLDGNLRWLSIPTSVRLPATGFFKPTDFFEGIGGETVVIGIDAPLGYPVAYRKLVSGESLSIKKPDAEIDNVFAYRDTERHIYRTFRKKPLSATFDKLGNNTSLAVATVRKWAEEHNFLLQPAPKLKWSKRTAIEVYPALIKTEKFAEVYPRMIKLIPAEVAGNSDAFDAALCAILALSYSLAGKSTGLPELVGPPTDWDIENGEGWIYYPKL